MLRQQSFRGLAGLAAAAALLTVGTEWAIGAGHGGGGGSRGGFSGGGFSRGGYGYGGGYGRGYGGYGYGRGYGGYGYGGGYGRGYGGYGYGRGYGGYGGYGYGGYGYGRGYGGYGYGRGYYGRGYYGGFGYGPGYFGIYFPYGYGNGYNSPVYALNDTYAPLSADGYKGSSAYSYAAPASPPPAMSNPAQADGYGDPSGYSYATPASSRPAMVNEVSGAAVFRVRVPADALVWFNDSKTEQTGAVRQFVSPRLAPVQAGVYDIRCRWEQNGRQMEQTRHVTVHAGDQLAINFLQ